jgi:hypothetical protein
MTPVAMPKLVEDARVSLFDHRTALAKANRRLVNSRTWYENIRAFYKGAKK